MTRQAHRALPGWEPRPETLALWQPAYHGRTGDRRGRARGTGGRPGRYGDPAAPSGATPAGPAPDAAASVTELTTDDPYNPQDVAFLHTALNHHELGIAMARLASDRAAPRRSATWPRRSA